MMKEEAEALFARATDVCGGVDALLSSFFGFLRDRTDFYTEYERAQIAVTRAFRENAPKAESADRKQPKTTKPLINQKSEETEYKIKTENKIRNENERKGEDDRDEGKREMGVGGGGDGGTLERGSSASLSEANSSESGSEENEGGKRTKGKLLKPNAVRGYETRTYKWSQTLKTFEVVFELAALFPHMSSDTFGPKFDAKKALKVDLSPKKLVITLSLPHTDASSSTSKNAVEFVFDSPVQELCWMIDLIRGKKWLVVTGDKGGAHSEWWPRLFELEPSLDVAKIEPENSRLSDLDGETRKLVEKMMLEQQQKNMPRKQGADQMALLRKVQEANPHLDFTNAKFN